MGNQISLQNFKPRLVEQASPIFRMLLGLPCDDDYFQKNGTTHHRGSAMRRVAVELVKQNEEIIKRRNKDEKRGRKYAKNIGKKYLR